MSGPAPLLLLVHPATNLKAQFVHLCQLVTRSKIKRINKIDSNEAEEEIKERTSSWGRRLKRASTVKKEQICNIEAPNGVTLNYMFLLYQLMLIYICIPFVYYIPQALVNFITFISITIRIL